MRAYTRFEEAMMRQREEKRQKNREELETTIRHLVESGKLDPHTIRRDVEQITQSYLRED